MSNMGGGKNPGGGGKKSGKQRKKKVKVKKGSLRELERGRHFALFRHCIRSLRKPPAAMICIKYYHLNVCTTQRPISDPHELK